MVAYALLGGAAWQWILRPLEEADLARNFGAQYEQYRREVRCWFPRLRAYRAARG